MTKLWKYMALPNDGMALMRRGLGGLCALDAALRVWNSSFYLSDLGVLPRNLYYSFFEQSWAWSVYQLSGYPQFCVFLLVITFGLGALQFAGRSTRGSRVVLWVLILSVGNRNPAIIDAYDDLLRLMLFWDIFLPQNGESQQQTVSPATVGWQWQLTAALVFWGLALSSDEVRLAVQWSGHQSGLDVIYLYRYAQVTLWILAASVWFKPLRTAALILVVPSLVGLAVELHPLLPLGFGVAGLSLFSRGKAAEQEHVRPVGGKVAWTATLLICVIVLLLNTVENSTVRKVTVPLGQGLGLLQDWGRYYPLGETDVAELVAKFGGRPVWVISSDSSRRDRLFAQRVARNSGWAVNLSLALTQRLELPGQPEVWMRKETLRKDFGLSSVEVVLLSATPVTAETTRLVTP